MIQKNLCSFRPILLLFVLVVWCFSFSPAQTQSFPFQNPDLSLEGRVDDLVGRMTLQEKVGQMLYTAPAIERLGIPEYNWWNEALHGVARAGRATVFPQAIGLAATWDTELMSRVATVISDEARAKHHESVRQGYRGIYEGLTFWSPNINIFRDPRWGRGMETFGEDPFLTGKLAVEFVKGMQGNDPKYLKTVATPKHFAVHSGPEPDRHVFDAQVSERDLRETYLPAFRMTIVDAHAQSVMCAYNRFRGNPCCGSDELLQHILRNEWNFDGYIVSDCWAISDFYMYHKVVPNAVEAAAMAAHSGTDLNCGVTYDSLVVAVTKGLVDEKVVDESVKRLFRARFRLGMFDPPERVAYARIPYSVNDSKKHNELAVETARKSIVLLKNENLLPLSKNLKTIAVIGPNADDEEILLGNYNGTPSNPITPLAGIRQKVGSITNVLYARGCAVAQNIPTLVPIPTSALRTETNANGLKAEYFGDQAFSGKPFATRTDAAVDFNWWEQAPLAGMKADSFSVRWTGTIVPPVSGRYALGARAMGELRLFFEDSLLVEFIDRHNLQTESKPLELKAGAAYRVRCEFADQRPDAIVQLVWEQPDPRLKEEALAAARRADAVVLMMGLSPRIEGEEMPVSIPGFKGGDRVDIGLPQVQEELMKEIVALCKPTRKPVVLVLLNGSALAVNWAAVNVPTIVEAWYPGQAAGTAIADVLFGDVNPAGRLPVTFYKTVDQLPPFSEYSMNERTYRYFTGEPLFPFGYGLSYTSFAYSNLTMPATVSSGEQVEISVDVENTGTMAGDEVVQLYVTDLHASVASALVPLRSLQGFTRVHLKAGEKQTVRFTLTPRQLSLIDEQNKRVQEPGVFEISVGGKQPGMKGLADAKTTGTISGRLEVVGEKKIIGELEE